MHSTRLLTYLLLVSAFLTGCGGGDAVVPTESHRTVVIGAPTGHLLGEEAGNDGDGAESSNERIFYLFSNQQGYVDGQRAQAITIEQLLAAFVPNSSPSDNLNWIVPAPSSNHYGSSGPDKVASQLANGDAYLTQFEITKTVYQCIHPEFALQPNIPTLFIDLNILRQGPAGFLKVVLTLQLSGYRVTC